MIRYQMRPSVFATIDTGFDTACPLRKSEDRSQGGRGGRIFMGGGMGSERSVA